MNQAKKDRERARLPLVVAFGLLLTLVSCTGVIALGIVLWPKPEVAQLLDFDTLDFPMPEVVSEAAVATTPTPDPSQPPPAPGKGPKPDPKVVKGPNIQVPDLTSSGGTTIPTADGVAAVEPDGPRRSKSGAIEGPAIGPTTIPGASTGAGGGIVIGGPKVRRDDGRTLEDPEEIRMMIGERMREYIPGLQFCYERRLKTDEGLAGRWSLTFSVMPTGAVESIGVKGLDQEDPELESCVADIVAERWRFSKISIQQPVKKTLTFKR